MDKKNIDLFTKHGIFTETEIKSRQEILYENYSKVINIEALTMAEMARKEILPAVNENIYDLTKTAINKKNLSDKLSNAYELKVVSKLSVLSDKLYTKIDALEKRVNEVKKISDIEKNALAYKDKVVPAMAELRQIADELEVNTGLKYWPYPTYGELLFKIQ